MKTETIKIENLKCQSCAKTISRELTWIGEVIDVNVSVDESTVRIDYVGKNRLRELFVDKLRKLGYPEKGTGTVNQRMRSYVSCAIGKIR